jgi:hypothetical protein
MTKAELTQLEIGFMMGLRAKDHHIRNTFFQLLDKNLPKDLLLRLENIFTLQNWEPMGSYFWIKQVIIFVYCN